MSDIQQLEQIVSDLLVDCAAHATVHRGELEVEVDKAQIRTVCQKLRDDAGTHFELLIDLCGVDYGSFGQVSETYAEGELQEQRRFAVVYHLLSIKHNHRMRLKIRLDASFPTLDSVVPVWNCADWYEREAFDLYGIIFQGHPDLRRLLTDYGFIGHPFRKDFPLSGHVEMRYDPEKARVVYEPVSIEPRVLVPRTIREEGYGGRNT